jgi:hypothetical protein
VRILADVVRDRMEIENIPGGGLREQVYIRG